MADKTPLIGGTPDPALLQSWAQGLQAQPDPSPPAFGGAHSDPFQLGSSAAPTQTNAPSTGDIAKDMSREMTERKEAPHREAMKEWSSMPPAAPAPLVGATNTRPMNFQRTDPATGQPMVPPGAIGPPTAEQLSSSFASGPAAKPFDPFKNEKAALETAQGRGLDRAKAESFVKDDRDKAFTDVRGEQDRYAKELADREPLRDEKRHELRGDLDAAIEKSQGNAVNEYLNSRNGAQQFEDILAAAAGGFLQGFRGLPSNPALDQMNKTIDRHVEEARRSKDAGVKGARESYERFLDETKSKDAASMYTHAVLLDGVRSKLDEAAANEHDLDRRYGIQDQSDAIAREVGRMKDEASRRAQAAQAAAYAAAHPTLDKVLEREGKIADIEGKRATTQKTLADAGGKDSKLSVNTPAGQREAISDNAQQTYTQIQRGAAGFQRGIDELTELRKQPWTPANQAKAEAIGAGLKQDFPAMKGVNRSPTEGELHALESIVPKNASAWSPLGTTDAQISAVSRMANDAMADAEASYLKPSAQAPSGESLRQSVATPKPPASFQGMGQ